jgi:hypothetical protein
VCGGRVVDLSALEAATNYDDGYHKNSKHVRWFWEVRTLVVHKSAAATKVLPPSVHPCVDS